MTKKIQERILRERGLMITQESKGKRRHIVSTPSQVPDNHKTPLMKMAEVTLGQPIEVILMSGSLSQVAGRIGCDPSTVSKMIERLKLRWTPDNLPDCQTCAGATWDCLNYGWCNVLENTDIKPTRNWNKGDLVNMKMEQILWNKYGR